MWCWQDLEDVRRLYEEKDAASNPEERLELRMISDDAYPETSQTMYK